MRTMTNNLHYICSTILLLTVLLCCSQVSTFSQFHWKHYNSQRRQHESIEDNNSVLRSYRRCMWEQSKYLPRRLIMLSLCANLFCENNQIVPRSRSIFIVERVSRPNDCLDILSDECEQGDEDELMYKPFPECCAVYCNLKRRMQRLRSMHIRHRRILDRPQATGSSLLLSEYGLNNISF